MSGRWLSIWLPEWPIERMALVAIRRGDPFPHDRPLALAAPVGGVPRLTAVDRLARAKGIRPEMAVADARAVLPTLEVRDAEPWTDATALASLALWCGRWSPKVAPDGPDGLLLDITGCTHLFGGEAALLEQVQARLERLGLSVRLGIADRRLAAWAWARFGTGGVLPEPARVKLLAGLPLRALRIGEALVGSLARLGFRTLGQLQGIPHAALQSRFGALLPARLAALGQIGDDQTGHGGGEAPFVPLQPPRRFATHATLAEPIARTDDILAVTRKLAWALCLDLERALEGVRQLELALHRVDGQVIALEVRFGHPSRTSTHLVRALAHRLDGLDVGFGIELIRLAALVTAPLEAEQAGLTDTADRAALARLADQLGLRLGQDRLWQLEPVASHRPERAVCRRTVGGDPAPALGPADRPRPHGRACDALAMVTGPRPVRLHARPRKVAVTAAIPDGPPRSLGRDRVQAALGPERIGPEWWRVVDQPMGQRDYWRALVQGRELWLCCESPTLTWTLQGSFD